MLRNTSAGTLDDTPVLSSYEIVLSAKSVMLVDLCRLNVPAYQYMKTRVLRLIFFDIEVIATEAHFVTHFFRH